jgi:hypothetical protein
MISMMIRYSNTVRVRIATLVVVTLTLASAIALPVQAAGIPNCNADGIATPCFEPVWVDGVQVKMIFVDLNPTPSNPSDVNFYVLAPQTDTPQGGPVPFFHDHVTDETRSREERHDGHHGDVNVHYHSFLVFCSPQGISSGACVPTMTTTPQGMVLFAKTVGGHRLTTSDRIESAANYGLLTLVDTGAVIVARIDRDEKPGDCD